MSAFARALAEARAAPDGRRWLLVPYDQLHDGIGPLAAEPPGGLGIILVESSWKASQRPYHKQKLALLLTSMRHFALEQARRGVAVRYLGAEAPYAEQLRPVLEEVGGARVMRPAERELRVHLRPLVEDGLLDVVPHEGWLTDAEDFASLGAPPWRLDAFYRRVRRRAGVLMQDGQPRGGRFSFDVHNRQPWRGEPAAPPPPRFRADAITREVLELVDARFAHHPGALAPQALPASRAQVERQWTWALGRCLEHFGPYEDAMSTRSTGLFHTRISALLNLHRLLPRRVLEDVLAADLPLASKEGFVRQVLGWREFVRHVHEATGGLRRIEGRRRPVDDAPGDGGWSSWRHERWDAAPPRVAGGARPSHLGARADVPPAFWGRPSGLACLDRVVGDVWREGYSHHITRLMVLGNLATLLDIAPRALTDWFWAAYTDAYDWVVEPNVLAMATFGTGPLMTTKPYVSGAAYIDRMSDYCRTCRFDPKRNCPVTRLYWAFLARKRKTLEGNVRMAMPLRSLARRAADERETDRRTYEAVRRSLERGEPVAPPVLP